MKASDQYHKWIEWSDEDHIYIGKCPDVMTGIHGDDPVRLYSEFCGEVDAVLHSLALEGRPLPHIHDCPMQAVL